MVLRGRASHLVRPPASGWCTLFGPSQHGRRTAWRPWSLLASLCRRSQHLSSLRGRRWARVCMHACSRDVWVESVPSVCASVAQLTSPLFAACGCGLACCTPSFRPHSDKTVISYTPSLSRVAAILRDTFSRENRPPGERATLTGALPIMWRVRCAPACRASSGSKGLARKGTRKLEVCSACATRQRERNGLQWLSVSPSAALMASTLASIAISLYSRGSSSCSPGAAARREQLTKIINPKKVRSTPKRFGGK